MQQFTELTIGNKYTIVGMTEFGFPYAIQCKMTKVTEIKPYAQHRESIEVHYVPFGKRKARGIRVLPHNTMVIFKNWVYPKVDMFPNDSGISLACFDRGYMKIALDSVEDKPVVVYGVGD